MNQASKVENIEERIKEIDPSITGHYRYVYSEPRLLASIAYGNLGYLANLLYFIQYKRSNHSFRFEFIRCNQFILNRLWQKENSNQLVALNWNQLA